MAHNTPGSVSTSPSRGVRWLVVAHVAVGVITTSLVKSTGRTDLARGALSGLWFGQMSLLGIWCSLGPTGHWKRLVGVVLGVGILYVWIGVASGDWSMEQLVFPGAFTAFVATPWLIARACRIVIQADPSATTLASRLQFSIRHLLVLTSVVAFMIALGKVVQPRIREWFDASQIVFYAASLILLGVVSAWLILATKRPVPYGVGLVAMSACSGYCPGLSSIFGVTASEMTVFTTTSTSVVVVSLLVVRRCGYQMVQLPKSTPRGSGLAEFSKPEIGNPDSHTSSLSP